MRSIDTDSIKSVYAQTVLSERCQIAVACLLAYDAIITMDREIRHFWRVPRQYVSLIYFSIRYIGISTAIFTIWFYSLSANKELCILTYWTHLVADWITVLLIDYILLMRVAALYLESHKVIRWLRMLFLLEAISELVIMLLVNVYQDIGVGDIPGHISVCQYMKIVPAKWGVLFWIIPMVYGFVLMTMAVYRTMQFWMATSETSTGSRLPLKSSQLIKVLVRDQPFYFLLVISCSVSNIIANRLGPNQFATVFLLNVLGSPSLLCVLGSHMLFHLKEASEKQSRHEMTESRGADYNSWMRTGETSDIRFAGQL